MFKALGEGPCPFEQDLCIAGLRSPFRPCVGGKLCFWVTLAVFRGHACLCTQKSLLVVPWGPRGTWVEACRADTLPSVLRLWPWRLTLKACVSTEGRLDPDNGREKVLGMQMEPERKERTD